MTSQPHAMDDIVPDSEQKGFLARLPQRPRDLIQLARLDRPIGSWLLFWPGAWAIALAGMALERWDLLLWFGLGSVAMRGAGCVYNDIVDADLDRKVERTRLRPVASGRVGKKVAWLWLLLLSSLGLVVLLNLPNSLAMLVALFSLALVAAYPFMKRITWWPQAWLGLVFSWAVPVAWASVGPGAQLGGSWQDWTFTSVLPGLLLYVGAIFWVIGYDTIYALQDIEDDALAGVKSSARAMGDHARLGIGSCYIVALGLWAGALWCVRPQSLTFLALLPAALHLSWQILALRVESAADGLAKFRSNRFCGLLLFMACLVVGMA